MLLICIIVLFFNVKSLEIATDCNVQLYNYYLTKGLNGGSVAMQQALQLQGGTSMGSTYVDATLAFQATARYYQSFINASFVAQTWSVANSLDVPWCASQINIMCCDNVSFATAKTSSCTSLIDFDPGGTNIVAGRMFTFNNQTTPVCNGTAVIRFYNVSLVPFFDADYTYDAVGLRDYVRLNYQDARQFYRNSTCLYSDGNPADIATQSLFRCTAQRIGCSGPRTNGQPTAPVIPIARYACIGNLTANGTSEILWVVCSAQESSGIDTTIGVAFTQNLGTGQALNNLFDAANGQYYVLIAGTCRQFASGYNTFNHYLLLAHNGYVTSYSPVYSLSNDPIVREIPCICGFSMACINGAADLASLASYNLYLSNALPIPNPGPNIRIPATTPTFTLNATESYDPDNLPGVLTVYWKIYNSPYNPLPPPYTITNPSSFINTINSGLLITGDYTFVLYASDSQAVTFTFFTASIQPNQLQALTEPRKIVFFDFYSGTTAGHSCLTDYPPSPFVTLDGSLSHGSDPSIPINYSWVQVAGPALLYKCDPGGNEPTRGFFDTTQAIANFVPYTIGSHYFRLTVCDNEACVDSLDLEVTVIPDFGQPPATFTPIINFTDPPIRNLTPPTRGDYTLPNLSFPPLSPQAPVAGPPPSNIIVPPLFPSYPSPTLSEWVGILFVFGSMSILFFAICVAWILYSQRTSYAYLDTVGFGPGINPWW